MGTFCPSDSAPRPRGHAPPAESDFVTDWDDPDEWDAGADDDSAVELPCPACGEPVYEDADVCPHCGDFITPGRRPAVANVPTWAAVLGVLGVIGTVLALALPW